MPNIINANGLQVAPYAEILAKLTAGLQSIYGPTINLNQNSPDGQQLNIFIQAVLDLEDLLVQINNGFDPDQAIGAILDQRVAINGIQRQGGTFTLTNITLEVAQSLNLPGLDGDINNPNGTGFTVADNSGNQWILAESQTFASAGSYSVLFRAKNSGAVLTVPNTITVPVTVVLGITSINNPSSYLSLGSNEESDAALRLRRQQSVSLSSQGYLQGLRAALLNVTGVTYAKIFENVTGSTDGDSIPSHSIWVVVLGGAPADIANAIYLKRNAGCGMKGSQTFTITQVDGTPFVIRWDIVAPEDLYIQFNASSLNGVDTPNPTTIAAGIVDKLKPGVFEQVNINELATIVQEIDPNCLVTGAGFSAALLGPYTNSLSPSSKNLQFALSAANISITVI